MREKLIKKGGKENMSQGASPKDPLDVSIRFITRFETKRIQEKLIRLILNIWANKL
jgi:hypothetical protein